MLKNILNLKSVVMLDKKQRKEIIGGARLCTLDSGTMHRSDGSEYNGNYLACFNDDGSVSYYGPLGEPLYC